MKAKNRLIASDWTEERLLPPGEWEVVDERRVVRVAGVHVTCVNEIRVVAVTR